MRPLGRPLLGSDRKEDEKKRAIQSVWAGRESFPGRRDRRRKIPLRGSSFE